MGHSEDRFTAAAAECLEVVRQTEATLDLFGRVMALEHLIKCAIWSLTVQRVDQEGGDNNDAIHEARPVQGKCHATIEDFLVSGDRPGEPHRRDYS